MTQRTLSIILLPGLLALALPACSSDGGSGQVGGDADTGAGADAIVEEDTSVGDSDTALLPDSDVPDSTIDVVEPDADLPDAPDFDVDTDILDPDSGEDVGADVVPDVGPDVVEPCPGGVCPAPCGLPAFDVPAQAPIDGYRDSSSLTLSGDADGDGREDLWVARDSAASSALLRATDDGRYRNTGADIDGALLDLADVTGDGTVEALVWRAGGTVALLDWQEGRLIDLDAVSITGSTREGTFFVPVGEALPQALVAREFPLSAAHLEFGEDGIVEALDDAPLFASNIEGGIDASGDDIVAVINPNGPPVLDIWSFEAGDWERKFSTSVGSPIVYDLLVEDVVGDASPEVIVGGSSGVDAFEVVGDELVARRRFGTTRYPGWFPDAEVVRDGGGAAWVLISARGLTEVWAANDVFSTMDTEPEPRATVVGSGPLFVSDGTWTTDTPSGVWVRHDISEALDGFANLRFAESSGSGASLLSGDWNGDGRLDAFSLSARGGALFYGADDGWELQGLPADLGDYEICARAHAGLLACVGDGVGLLDPRALAPLDNAFSEDARRFLGATPLVASTADGSGVIYALDFGALEIPDWASPWDEDEPAPRAWIQIDTTGTAESPVVYVGGLQDPVTALLSLQSPSGPLTVSVGPRIIREDSFNSALLEDDTSGSIAIAWPRNGADEPDDLVLIQGNIARVLGLDFGADGDAELADVQDLTFAPPAARGMALSQLDDDELQDVVIATDVAGELYAWLTSDSARPQSLGRTFLRPERALSGDTDGDGDADIVIASASPPGLVLIEGRCEE